VLGLMLIVALGMLYGFWRRGWIGAGPKKELQPKSPHEAT
jgi:hypothetical protein